MSPKARARNRGISAVFTAAIMALAVILIIAAIAVSWPMIKSTFDKNYWSGSMGIYNLKFTNSTYAYAQNGVGGQVGTNPTPIGYCIALSPGTTYAISTCPSTTPSYQSPPPQSPQSSQPSPPPSNNNYYVYVTVTGDSYGAGWRVSSSASSISGSSNVNMEQLQIGGQTDTLNAQITSSPSGYTCTISPSTEQVTSGNTYTFTVSCVQSSQPQPITVSVSDSYGAGWLITWSGAASGSQSGSSSDTFTVQPTSNVAVTFTASITSNPSGYQCTISPSSTTAYPGQSVSFTVSCQPIAYYVYVTVTGDSPGAGWQVSSSVTSISGTGNVNNEQLKIGGQTDTVTAKITSNPPGYSCSISPTSVTAQAGQTIPFTVSCQLQPPPSTYGCLLTVKGQGIPSGAPAPTVNPTSAFVPSGQSVRITATAPLATSPSSVSSGEKWYTFTGWTYNLNGQGTANLGSTWTSGNNAYSTWQYTCPSGLTSNATATLTINADYWTDYLYISGTTFILQGTTTAKYTITWNAYPGSATQVQWSVSPSSQGAFTVTATLTYTENGATYQATASERVTLFCFLGTPVVYSISINPTSQQVSQSVGSATATVTINWTCRL